jgi:colanic acid/amylovoran biosynthesis glycosyltransferase
VEDGVTGFLVPFKDVDALAERITRLLDDHALCDRMGEAGAKAAQERFSFEKANAEYLSLISAFMRAAER